MYARNWKDYGFILIKPKVNMGEGRIGTTVVFILKRVAKKCPYCIF